MQLTPKEEAVLHLIEDFPYESYFFNKVSAVKWFYPLKGKGYFSPDKAPCPIEEEQKGYFRIPQWNILPYLEKVSQQVTIQGNEKYIEELLTIIKDVTRYHVEHNKCLDNYRTWWYFAKILLNIPNSKIDHRIIELIPIWLDSKYDTMLQSPVILEKLLPKFLDGKNPEDVKKAERIVEIVTMIKWIPKYTSEQKKEIVEKHKHIFEKSENERTEEEKLLVALLGLEKEEPKTVIDTYWLREFFINKRIAVEAGKKCSEGVIFDLANKLKEIFYRRHPDKAIDLSCIWCKSLFEPSMHAAGTEEILTLILSNIVLAKAESDEETTRKIFGKFLGDEYPYLLFRRLILFVIGNEWDRYKDAFWRILDRDKEGVLFNDPHLKPEVYHILEKNIERFSSEKKNRIKRIIEEKVPRKPHPEEKYRKYHEAYRKQKWYSAMKSDSFFGPLYEEQRKITQREETISFKEPEIRISPRLSSLTKEEIIGMQNRKLAEYLKEFRAVDSWKGPTVEGLSGMIEMAVQENPQKFIDDLKPFLKTGYLYVYGILWGIRDAWEKRSPIDWGKLFDFVRQYVSTKDFWDDEHKVDGDDLHADHLWIIGMFNSLVIQGTHDDSWTFSEEYFEICQEILFEMLDGMLKEKERIIYEQPVSDDLVTNALNSSFGKITEALFMLALRIKRSEEKSKTKQPVGWELNIKDKYDEILKHDIAEGYVWLGRYLPNFYYLDETWTKTKIRTISLEKERLWKAFMEGYLFSNKIYDDLYKLMRQHYLDSTGYEFKDRHSTERLVQHICIEYLRGIEEISDEDGLLGKLLDKWNPIQIKEIIGYFWMQRDWLIKAIKDKLEIKETSKVKTIRERIIDFWRWTYQNRYKGKQELSEEDKKIIADLSRLTVFLSEINSENLEWLKLSASYVHLGFNSPHFIAYLDGLKDKDEDAARYVGEIFLKMLEFEASTPDYDQRYIRSIVEHLYLSGCKDCADEICDKYASRQLLFLRDIYEKYHKNNKGAGQ